MNTMNTMNTVSAGSFTTGRYTRGATLSVSPADWQPARRAERRPRLYAATVADALELPRFANKRGEQYTTNLRGLMSPYMSYRSYGSYNSAASGPTLAPKIAVSPCISGDGALY